MCDDKAKAAITISGTDAIMQLKPNAIKQLISKLETKKKTLLATSKKKPNVSADDITTADEVDTIVPRLSDLLEILKSASASLASASSPSDDVSEALVRCLTPGLPFLPQISTVVLKHMFERTVSACVGRLSNLELDIDWLKLPPSYSLYLAAAPPTLSASTVTSLSTLAHLTAMPEPLAVKVQSAAIEKIAMHIITTLRRYESGSVSRSSL